MKVYSTLNGVPLYARQSPKSTSLLSRLHRLQEAIRRKEIPASALTHLLTVKGEVQGYGVLNGVCDIKGGGNVGADMFWDPNNAFAVIRHEIGHNFGGKHCPAGVGKGGIMCGNSAINGAVQFQEWNKKNICSRLKQVVNKCEGQFKPASGPPSGPPRRRRAPPRRRRAPPRRRRAPPPSSRRRGHGRRGCFPSDSKVMTPDGGQVFLRDLVRGQLISAPSLRTNRVVFERFLGDLHSDAEHSQISEFLNITHEYGSLRLSATHLVKTIEHGFAPADQLQTGDHVLVSVQHAKQLQASKVVSIETIVGMGLYAPLTFSGTIIVDGAVASTYTVDELRQYTKLRTQQRIIEVFGYNGVNSIMHALAFPLRLSFLIGLPELIDRAMSLGLPGSTLISRFFLPSKERAVLRDTGSDLPSYVDFAGRAVGFTFDAAFSR